MSNAEERRLQALVRKNAAKVEAQRARKQPKRFDDTLQKSDDGDDPELRRFFKDMKRREF